MTDVAIDRADAPHVRVVRVGQSAEEHFTEFARASSAAVSASERSST